MVRAGSPADEVSAALRAIAPDGVVVGARSIDVVDLDALHAAEASVVASAVPKRRREFATGRALLRLLLGADVTILPGPTRAPVLPPGVCGTLAHDDRLAVAAVTRRPSIAALGVDIEPATPLADDIAEVVLRPEERLLDAHLAFTLKEAAYKAWSGLGGRILDHHEVSLTVRDGRFDARVVDDGLTLTGAWTVAGGRYVALVVHGDHVGTWPSGAAPERHSTTSAPHDGGRILMPPRGC